MAVDDPDKVDFISIDKSGVMELTISDHLEWDEEHLRQLQTKIYRYLDFIDSGELLSSYPKAAGRSVAIRVVCMHEPSPAGWDFLGQLRAVATAKGVALSVDVPA